MASRQREIFATFTQELEARGVSTYTYRRASKHDQLIVTRGTQRRTVTFSRHATDWRAMKNNVAHLRRALDELGFAA